MNAQQKIQRQSKEKDQVAQMSMVAPDGTSQTKRVIKLNSSSSAKVPPSPNNAADAKQTQVKFSAIDTESNAAATAHDDAQSPEKLDVPRKKVYIKAKSGKLVEQTELVREQVNNKKELSDSVEELNMKN